MAGRQRKQPVVEPTPPPPEVPEEPIQEVPPPPLPQLYTQVVFVLPYKSSDLVRWIEEAQQKVCCEALGLQTISRKALVYRTFTAQQVQNPNFDVLTGFELIDSEWRLYLIQGLAQGCLMRFINQLPRLEANDQNFKYLMNTQVKFTQRKYLQFGADLKRIKLREPLSKILMNPDIYIKTKVSEELMNTLHKLMQIRRANRIKYIKNFDLAPTVDELQKLERKYGDALTHQDIYWTSSINYKVSFIDKMSMKTKNVENSPIRKSRTPKKKFKAPLDMENPDYENILEKRKISPTRDFTKQNRNIVRNASLQLRALRSQKFKRLPDEDEQIFIYSGQKLKKTENFKWSPNQSKTQTHKTIKD